MKFWLSYEEDNAFGPTITFDVCTTGSPPSEQPIDSDIADGGITSETNDPPDETVNMDGNDGGTPGVSPPDFGTAPDFAGDNEQTAQLEKSDSSPSIEQCRNNGMRL